MYLGPSNGEDSRSGGGEGSRVGESSGVWSRDKSGFSGGDSGQGSRRDFNTVQGLADVGGETKLNNNVSRSVFTDICAKYNLMDVWRVLNPGRRVLSLENYAFLLIKGVLLLLFLISFMG